MLLSSLFRKGLKALLLLAIAESAGAQTSPQAPLRQLGSDNYWIVLDECANRIVHFASAKLFVQLHAGSLTERQCQQYSRIAGDYADEFSALKRARLSPQGEFWNDVRMYSIKMIGAPGVPIPVHRTSMYWITTGSDAGDGELRRIVSLEIDEATSQLADETDNAPSAFIQYCGHSTEQPITKSKQ